ncbi:hypothetical protein AB1Y20_023088 [Prymnesium parvum]|uniref:Uncharacterized protein n=1 Tax=Prymnesium parvum TaxID=97485 RepID=A0AB34IIN6_PRYPA
MRRMLLAFVHERPLLSLAAIWIFFFGAVAIHYYVRASSAEYNGSIMAAVILSGRSREDVVESLSIFQFMLFGAPAAVIELMFATWASCYIVSKSTPHWAVRIVSIIPNVYLAYSIFWSHLHGLSALRVNVSKQEQSVDLTHRCPTGSEIVCTVTFVHNILAVLIGSTNWWMLAYAMCGSVAPLLKHMRLAFRAWFIANGLNMTATIYVMFTAGGSKMIAHAAEATLTPDLMSFNYAIARHLLLVVVAQISIPLLDMWLARRFCSKNDLSLL